MRSLINVSEGAFLAMHGLVYIAQNASERVNIKKLAEVLNASEAHLAKVFQKMSKAGLVRSVRGPSGGFELNHSLEEINFLDVVEIVDGKTTLNGCPFGKSKCAFNTCIFGTRLNSVTQEIYDIFLQSKLSDLV
ncbi:MAG TPA: Rrf2 family transcriptional regulator [Candidatus Cloacimonadota bacterium]|nr:Rrf2 family transcriptional regulator [Candidatus Cloacimonadota bacterium]